MTRQVPVAVRWARLLGGLWLFASGIALMVRAHLGVSSWDVLHDALRLKTTLTFGAAVIAVSVVVVAASYVMGVKPGPGTLANVILVGLFTDAILLTGFLDDLSSRILLVRLLALLLGVVAIAFGTATYISAGLGAGPRDSLMLASATRLGVSTGMARALIEGTVLIAGAVMGGRVGPGTALFAVAIGPVINMSFRLFGMEPPRRKGGSNEATVVRGQRFHLGGRRTKPGSGCHARRGIGVRLHLCERSPVREHA